MMVNDELGGEKIAMKLVAKLLEVEVLTLLNSKGTTIQSGILSKILFTIYTKTRSKFLKEFISLIYPHFVDVSNLGDIVIFSSGGALIPTGKNVVGFIQTPFRAFSDYYVDYREQLKRRNMALYLIFPLIAKIYNKIYIHSLLGAKQLVCNSETIRSRLKKYYGLDAEVLYEGIDATLYHNSVAGDYFLTVSRFERAKNLTLILRAFGSFQRKNSEFRLIIAGKSADVDSRTYVEELKEYIFENKLRVDIVANPTMEQLLDLYSKSFAFLFSAINEDFGLVLLEAMASEKPVISINCGGPTEIVIENVTGFLVNDENQMADKMVYLTTNRNVAINLGKNGKDRVLQEFSAEAFHHRLLECILSLKREP